LYCTGTHAIQQKGVNAAVGGRDDEWDASIFPPFSYSIIYDGKLVRGSDSWLFDLVQFDDS
jgi:hypothetical protein